MADMNNFSIGNNDEMLNIILTDEPNKQPEQNIDAEKQDDKLNKDGTNVSPKKTTSKDDEFITINLTDENEKIEEPIVNQQPDEKDYNYKEVVRYAIDKGIFTDTGLEELESLPEGLDGLTTVLQKELKTGIDIGTQNWIDAINARSEGLVEHLLNGGNVNDYIKVFATDYNKINEQSILNDIQLQEKLVYEDYKESTTWSDDKISKYIAKLKDLDELKDEAKTSLKGLQDRSVQRRVELEQSTKKQKLQLEQQHAQRIAFINKTIADTSEFAGVKITPKLKNIVTENIMNDTTFNKINSNLDKYRVNLAYLDSLGLLDGDITNVKRVLGDKVSKEVKKEIVEYDFSRGKTKAPKEKAATKDILTSLMDKIDSKFDDKFFN